MKQSERIIGLELERSELVQVEEDRGSEAERNRAGGRLLFSFIGWRRDVGGVGEREIADCARASRRRRVPLQGREEACGVCASPQRRIPNRKEPGRLCTARTGSDKAAGGQSCVQSARESFRLACKGVRDEGEALEDAAAVAVPRGERDDERHQLARQLPKRARAAAFHPVSAPAKAHGQEEGSME